MNQKNLLISLFATFTLAALVSLLNFYHLVAVSPVVIKAAWWLFTAASVLYAFKKRSLTTWILVSMVIGIQIGFEFRELALNLQVLSKVFLKLIKTIIGPILFATLVVGIAGHSNMKQLGRMGWKSLVYFEVVTTIALVIGLVAINVTKAGKNIDVPHTLSSDIPLSKKKELQKEIIGVMEASGVDVPEGTLEKLTRYA
ncbi:MAG: cation:dicarboxylase symporter family transporter [Leadbetterella sp.]|nr:cation:dicarboxylase symporter family transporter [Leadbetterella sp.]